MRRLLLLLAAGLALALPVWGGQPPAETKAGSETPAGWTVRNISAGSQTIKLSGAAKIHLRGDGSVRQGKSKTQNGLQLEGCSNILVTGLTFQGWYCGVKCQNSNGISFRDIICTKNYQQGWLFTNGKQIEMRSCEGSKTGGTSKSQHSCYFGNFSNGYTQDILCEDCSFYGSAMADWQTNSESASRAAKNIVLRRCRVNNPKFSCNVLGATVLMEGCTVQSNVKAFSLACPYGRRSWPSMVTLRNSTYQGRAYVEKGSKLVKE